MSCIFCDARVLLGSNEHIVPESLGNLHYILRRGFICRKCNNSFSEFEDKALSKTMLGFERSRLGIATKKGNAAQAKSHNIQFKGDKNFTKNRVTVFGLEEKDIEEVLPDGSFKIKILDFDKSDMATSKLLLKIGVESLFQSQLDVYRAHDFTALKQHLTKVNNDHWPILTTSLKSSALADFQSVPRFLDKKRLKDLRCELLYKMAGNELLFNFRYSVLSYVVSLSSRSIQWAKPFFEADHLANLYPEHLKKKLRP